MTKTIKICDKCGAEVDWLYEFHRLNIKGLRLEVAEYDKFDLCKECAKEFVNMYNFYTVKPMEVSL